MEMELKYMDNVYKWKGNVPHTIVRHMWSNIAAYER